MFESLQTAAPTTIATSNVEGWRVRERLSQFGTLFLPQRFGQMAYFSGTPSSAVLLRQPSRRTADPTIEVWRLVEAVDALMERAGTRDLSEHLRRLKLEATWKTAPTAAR